MSNHFSGQGNLGTDPELNTVNVDDEERQVADMRIRFDRPIPNSDGGFDDKDGFWLTVSIWDKRAVHAKEHLSKGCRVHVDGELREDQWTDPDTQEQRHKLRLVAEWITLDPCCIETVSYRKSTRQAA